MTDIQTKIFNEYFNNNDNLKTLYNWLDDDSENKFHIESTSFATKIEQGSGLGELAETNFFNGHNSGLHTDISTTIPVVVKQGTEYCFTDYQENNANHFIPYIPVNILNAIDTSHKNKIQNIFYIYQLYDYLAENPEEIGLNSSITINFYDFFTLIDLDTLDPGSYDIDSTDVTINSKTCFPFAQSYADGANGAQSHYKQIITNSANIELTPSLIYICRGIFLVLLYKNILEIYISYFNYIEDSDTANYDEACKNNSRNETKNLIMSKVFHSMNKINYFLSYKLEVKYVIESGSNKLVIHNQGADATTSFDSLLPKRHILYNSTDKKYHKINTIITKTNDYYTISNSTDLEPVIHNDPSYESKTLYILSKKADHAAKNYNDVRSKLENVNSKLEENKFENQKSITNLNVIKGSFNNIDYLYYITIIITIICLIVIFFAKSEQSRKSHVFIMLIIVSLTYGIIFSFIQKAKEFSESFNTDDVKNRLINQSNSKFDDYLKLVYMESANYGATTLYNELESVASRDLIKSNKKNKIIESEINGNDANSISEWHRLFQRTLFIHTMFLFLIVVLIYLWLSIIMPDISIYLLFITIIACMLLIFYYFRNLHRVVRTEYKQKYWTKMSV